MAVRYTIKRARKRGVVASAIGQLLLVVLGCMLIVGALAR